MVPIRLAVHMVSPWNLLDEKGVLNTSSFDAAGDAMLDQLIWWAETLKAARDKDAAGKV